MWVRILDNSLPLGSPDRRADRLHFEVSKEDLARNEHDRLDKAHLRHRWIRPHHSSRVAIPDPEADN